MESSDLVIIHLSDLHFCKYLFTKRKDTVFKFIRKGHDHNLLKGLENAFFEIIQQFKSVSPTDIADHPRNLIVLVTGDITTDGKRESYKHAENFLTKRIVVDSVSIGLNLPRDNLFVVPGNHDIWMPTPKLLKNWILAKQGKTLCEVYCEFFNKELPYVVCKCVNGINFSIFGLDSNVSTGGSNLENILGRGLVGQDQLNTIEKLKNANDQSPGLRIAILHHHIYPHPDDDKLILEFQNENEQSAWFTENMSLDDLKLIDADLVKSALSQMGIDMVFCGHLHCCHFKPQGEMPDGGSKIYYSCTGSATQRSLISKNGNGLENRFCVYKIKKIEKSTFGVTAEWHRADKWWCFYVERTDYHEINCK